MKQFPNEDVLPDSEQMGNAIRYSIKAMHKLAQRMAETDMIDNIEDPAKAGQTMAYLAKMVDGMTRLIQFAKGEADSRTEVVGLVDLLQHLTNDQFAQVQAWVAESEARQAPTLQ